MDPTSRARGRREAIVVSGDPAQRVLLASLLECEGLGVRIFDGTDAALAAIGTAAPPALFVAEVSAPGLDGWRLCRLLRSAGYEPFNAVPILVVSSTLAGQEPALVTTSLGGTAFLPSPFDPGRFVDAVRALLAVEPSTITRRLDDEPQESMQKYRSLFEQSIDGIFLHDLDGTILDVNRAAIAQSGHTKEALLRMSVFDLLVDAPPPEGIVQQWRAWAPSDSFIIEARHRRADGTVHPVEVNTGKVSVGKRELMLAIVRDIAERKRAEGDKQKLEEQLRHAQKLEAVGRLAGGLAHDFNNMLCAILGNTELTLARLATDDPIRESLETVVAAAQRAGNLTRQLLAFSRRQVTEPKVVNLGELIEKLHPMLTRLLGEDIILRTVANEGVDSIRADAGQLEQVVLNLAVNARDAMPEGGELLIETASVRLDETYCATHANATPGHFVMLAVSDTGVGMDADTRSRIFEPFFTTKELGKGTGLGLATVYGIVEQSGGGIEVYSEPGQGTSFKIYLPRVAGTAEALVPDTPRPPARGDETVLLVEDDAMVRDVAVQMLERSGYRVLAAASAAEALEKARHHAGTIELLLTDVVMPNMNGRQLATLLTEARPNIKVLYSSGYTENVLGRHRVLDEGVQFVAKPYSLDSLTARVREVLDTPSPTGK